LTRIVLEASGLELRRDERTILSGLDWTVCEGERWVILGPNGCGKTTLSQTLQGRLQPWQGKLTILGKTFGTMDITDLRKEVGFAGEALERLFPENLTLEDLVASARLGTIGVLFDEPTRADRQGARAELTRLGLGDKGKQTYRTCSLGERRKALIARALNAKPRFLVLDEPFAGLDPAAREELLIHLSRLARDQPDLPMLLVTHHVEEIPPEWTHGLLFSGAGFHCGPLKKILTQLNLSSIYGHPFALKRFSGRFFLLPR
jgi:iron complex transport system ATP-binding protein